MSTPSQAPLPAIGGPGYHLAPEELEGFLAEHLAGIAVEGRSVCLIIPDDTRSCPLPMMLGIVHRHLVQRAASLDCVIALGTHEYMEPEEIACWTVGDPAAEMAEAYPGMRIHNHEFKDPRMLVRVGRISDQRMAELSEGRLTTGSEIMINRLVVEADIKIIIGPVLPHEVVGISGGNKYFIPGVAQAEFIDRTHWVGALITSATMIGTTGITPVRAMINEGAAMVPGEKYCLSVVVRAHSNELEAAAFGTPESAWASMAEVAAVTHVEYVDQPFGRVISEIPQRYHDIWTAAKGFYKLEPAVRDGGEVVIFAPHITEVSEVHHEILQIGYHCRDYFVSQWDRFRHIPWGVLAHSTHLRGAGSYDPATGVESLRVRVTLATRIPREVCESINLGYLDPDTVDLAALATEPDTVVIHDAGEVLYRLSSERRD